jgi:hypothetical protein
MRAATLNGYFGDSADLAALVSHPGAAFRFFGPVPPFQQDRHYQRIIKIAA